MANVRFEKVKNEYRFIREDGKYWFLDVNDGKWHGIYGHEIDYLPNYIFRNISYPNNTSHTLMYNLLFSDNNVLKNLQYLKYFDAIFSILLNENKKNKPIRWFDVSDLFFYYQNIKMLSEYLRSFEDKEDINMCSYNFKEFLFEKKYKNYMDLLNLNILPLGELSFYGIVKDCMYDLRIVDVDLFMKKYGMNLIHYWNKGFFSVLEVDYMARYYKMCKDLGVAPKKGDFIKNYSEIKKIRKQKDYEIKQKKIKENQTREDFSFENEDFYVSVPTTLEEFIELGEEFHNCIDSWELENRIIPQECTLVILRAKNESWKIACDFTNSDFHINQFYKPCNERVELEDFELIKAREIYQNHLYTLRNK